MSIPQILQQLNGAQTPNLSGVKQIMDMLRGNGNPMAVIQSLIGNNPKFQQVTSLVQQYGNDPQKAFYALCEQKGVDPNQILAQLR